MVKITIGTKENPVRFSYANVHEPVSVNGSDLKYSVALFTMAPSCFTLKWMASRNTTA